jgi:hypothetical protein
MHQPRTCTMLSCSNPGIVMVTALQAHAILAICCNGDIPFPTMPSSVGELGSVLRCSVSKQWGKQPEAVYCDEAWTMHFARILCPHVQRHGILQCVLIICGVYSLLSIRRMLNVEKSMAYVRWSIIGSTLWSWYLASECTKFFEMRIRYG